MDERSPDDRLFREALGPLRAALGGQSVQSWIEQEAERLAASARVDAHIELDRNYLDQLRAKLKTIPYREALAGDSAHIKASARMSARATTIKALALPIEDLRAVLAHELGHVVLYSNEAVSKELGRGDLLVNPIEERLAEDLGRALLLPSSLIAEFVGSMEDADLRERAWGLIPRIAKNAIVPLKYTASRIAQFAARKKSLLLCYGAPAETQLGLFNESSRARAVVTVKWVMAYDWIATLDDPRSYFSARQVGRQMKRALRASMAEQVEAQTLGPVPAGFGQWLAGPKIMDAHPWAKAFERCASFEIETPRGVERVSLVLARDTSSRSSQIPAAPNV